MFEKIKEALKAKGLPEDLAGLIHVTQESEIEGAVNQLNNGISTLTQKEGDKRATEARKTVVKKLGLSEDASDEDIQNAVNQSSTQGQPASGGSPGASGQSGQQTGQQTGSQQTGQQTGQNGGEPQGQTSNPEIEELKKTIQQTQDELTSMKQKEQIAQRKNDFIKKLKDKNIPESFAKTFSENVDFNNLDSDEKLNKYVEQVEEVTNEYEKERLGTSVNNNQQPGQGQPTEQVQKEVQEAAKERYNKESTGEGKKI